MTTPAEKGEMMVGMRCQDITSMYKWMNVRVIEEKDKVSLLECEMSNKWLEAGVNI